MAAISTSIPIPTPYPWRICFIATSSPNFKSKYSVYVVRRTQRPHLSENSISGAPASAGNPSTASETCRGYLGVVDRCRGKRAVSWGQDDTPHSKFEIWLSGKCCALAARCYSHPAMPSLFLFTELTLSTTHTIRCSRHPL